MKRRKDEKTKRTTRDDTTARWLLLSSQAYYKDPNRAAFPRVLQEHFPLRFTNPNSNNCWAATILVSEPLRYDGLMKVYGGTRKFLQTPASKNVCRIPGTNFPIQYVLYSKAAFKVVLKAALRPLVSLFEGTLCGLECFQKTTKRPP